MSYENPFGRERGVTLKEEDGSSEIGSREALMLVSSFTHAFSKCLLASSTIRKCAGGCERR